MTVDASVVSVWARMVEEFEQLRGRVHRLEGFLESEKCEVVSELERELMRMQLDAMRKYRSILHARIALMGTE